MIKVLQIHNRYRSIGGEDLSVARDAELMDAEEGLAVSRMWLGGPESLTPYWSVPFAMVKNPILTQRLRRISAQFQPDIIHINNIWPLMGPEMFKAASELAPGVVLTLRNYRPTCGAATNFRDGAPCFDCAGGKRVWPAVQHRCLDGKLGKSLLGGVATHAAWAAEVYERHVSRFIALSHSHRAVYVQQGWDPDRISVRPNPVQSGDYIGTHKGYVVYVGRPGADKGADRVLRAWEQLGDELPPLRVIGPFAERVAPPNVTFMGVLPREPLLREVSDALALLAPGRWIEPFGRNGIEALSCGTPLVVGNRGNLSDIVREKQVGVVWRDEHDALALRSELTLVRASYTKMSQDARAVYLSDYTEGDCMEQLTQIYKDVLTQR